MSTSKRAKMPDEGREVKVLNPITEDWMYGLAGGKLSSQWLMHLERGGTTVIHSNWQWRYTNAESGE